MHRLILSVWKAAPTVYWLTRDCRCPGPIFPKPMPWMRDAVDWVLDNRPKERETAAICHGDFNASNILIQDGQISGILDWHLSIADPAYGIARTIQVLSLFYKLWIPESDWAILEGNTQKYLNAYQTILPLNDSKIIYGRIVYCMFCLFLGAVGSPIMRHPVVVKDQIEFIDKVTGFACQCLIGQIRSKHAHNQEKRCLIAPEKNLSMEENSNLNWP